MGAAFQPRHGKSIESISHQVNQLLLHSVFCPLSYDFWLLDSDSWILAPLPFALRPVSYALSKFALRNPKFAMFFHAPCSMPIMIDRGCQFCYKSGRKCQAHWWGSRTSNPVWGSEGCPRWVRFPCTSANLCIISSTYKSQDYYRTTTKTRHGPYRGAFSFYSSDDFRVKG